ncbi:MAG: bifunctional phosphopantothenoylcysteine decarboxylase/phosphopantothenate--cysteine ligase CoaBC [Alphaproteobacteria bacterium]|nr:bifunctional phosphopantothenoylcysteine decarboxylase/phosphopantothenate--cysteine ligase CoaBC [Alphaproteobacteria bacterium]
MLKNKKIILGITGGIAAYKCIYLLRLLVTEGAVVKVIMTPNATNFVSPLVLSTLSKNAVGIHLIENNSWENHIHLAHWADLFIVAPLTCNTLSKMAQGSCDNLLLATFLSIKCPVVVAPAMDEDMWFNDAVQQNFKLIKERQVLVIPVNVGELASGIYGHGRLAEPEQILSYIKNKFFRTTEFLNKKILITCGPTKEKIDPVRYISNYSSGKMGFALAESFYEKGADVFLISGTNLLNLKYNDIHFTYTESAEDMFLKCKSLAKEMDYLILSAAVADYKPTEIATQKMKKDSTDIHIQLTKTQDILLYLGQHKLEHQTLIGFALETNNGFDNATKKLKNKNLDYIILNEISNQNQCFQSDENEVTMISKNFETQTYPKQSKKELAHKITLYLAHKISHKL